MILLVDGDELLHVCLAACEHEVKWSDDVWTLSVNESEALDAIQRKMHTYNELFTPSDIIVGFSGDGNWRRGVDASYKARRASTRKPMLFRLLKERSLAGELLGDAMCVSRPQLEADDVLGILATKPENKGNTLIVSRDKDFKGIPGRLWRTGDERPPAILGISEEAADIWHLTQALAGDAIDGYPGCPGIGIEIAGRMLHERVKFAPHSKIISRGPRKGLEVIEWDTEPADTLWEVVVSCYERAGLSAQDALVQARLARILRWEDWDSTRQEVKLWLPKTL